MTRKPLRSAHSYGKLDRDGLIHRSWMKSSCLSEDVFDGRPVIGACNTWSELPNGNVHLRDIAERVKRGVWEAEADQGRDLDFLVGATSAEVKRDSH